MPTCRASWRASVLAYAFTVRRSHGKVSHKLSGLLLLLLGGGEGDHL